MKNLLIKASLVCLALATVFGCGPDNKVEGGVGDFNLQVKNVGPDFVELAVTAPSAVEMAYIVSEENQLLSPPVLFMTGKTITVNPGDVIKVKDNFQSNTDYFLFAAAKLDGKNYSEMVTLEFKTKDYDFSRMLTVVETKYDGYKVHVTVPEEVKEAGNAIRYGGTNQAFYNVLVNQTGSEAVHILNSVVANGNRHGNYVLDDATLLYDNSNIVLLDENGDPVLDENGDQIDIHEPIAPGEPTVFLAGECAYGTDEEMGAITGWYYGVTDKSYQVAQFDWDTIDPAFDWDNTDRDNDEWAGSGWTGAFQKLVFKTKEPGHTDATVHIDIPEEEITVTDAVIYFEMDDEVSRYFYIILDNQTYNNVVDIYLDKRDAPQEEIDEAFQWFLTSYLAFYEWGIGGVMEDIQVHAATSFQNNVLIGGETYHVLCTVQVDDPTADDNPTNGALQNFVHKTFTAKEKTKPAPVIEVTAVENGDPYFATFNIKAPNKDLVGAYWACNYAREFQLMLNADYTYESLLMGNYTFGPEDIMEINSDEGFEVSFNTLDGETMRFVAYGCNDEYTFNRIDPDTKGAGWADYKAPMAEADPYIASDYYDALAGDWTATATIKVNELQDDETVVSRNVTHSSKVTIGRSINDFPEYGLTADDYALYEGMDREEVDGMYEELNTLAETFTESRIEGQNRMLCTGFIDFDYQSPSRVEYMSLYDLFTHPNYNSVDVPQLVYDFGPKWFLEVQEDGSLIVPMSSMYLPPMHAWPGYPYYVGAYGIGKDESGADVAYAFYDGTETVKGFPVEVSADNNTITIKPIVLEDGSKYYMNALGVNPQNYGSVEIVATVMTEVVLTRGWTAPKAKTADYVSAPVKARAATMDGKPVTEMPKAKVIKSVTELKVNPRKNFKVDETPNVVTMDMVEATTEKILKHFNVK